VVVTAHVIKEGNVQSDAPDSLHQRIDVETEQIESPAEKKAVHMGVRLNIYSGIGSASDEESPESDSSEPDHIKGMKLLRYGQRIKFSATLNPPRNFRTLGAFDYAGYLRDNGIAATAATKYEELEILPGFSGSQLQLWRARVHRSVVGKVHALWPESVAGLMDAIVIGEDTFIDRSTRTDFQRSGTYHILVVSGMNVSILAVVTLWFFRRLGFGEIASSAIGVALIFAYAALT
jgi:predicted membrane metal-binding protein